MKFDLKNLNPGAFFPFDEGEGGVTIRVANAKILEEIDKKCTKKKVEYKRGQRFETIDDDQKLRSELLWDYVIIDWEGVEDIEGNEIPCNKDNKILLMKESVKFSSFIGKCVEKLSDDEAEYAEDQEKN